MNYKITKDGITQEVNERNLNWYKQKGWEVVANEVATPTISENLKNLTKAHLQDLCKDKGIAYKHTDKKEVLINKLEVVNEKTLLEKSASNKGFTDSLITNK